jgi:hypothetical protein
MEKLSTRILDSVDLTHPDRILTVDWEILKKRQFSRL